MLAQLEQLSLRQEYYLDDPTPFQSRDFPPAGDRGQSEIQYMRTPSTVPDIDRKGQVSRNKNYF